VIIINDSIDNDNDDNNNDNDCDNNDGDDNDDHMIIIMELGYGAMHSMGHLRAMNQFFIFKI
jgi:hypothetical protein